MGCGSKPFTSRLFRFSVLFVGCVVISLLSLSDCGRRLFLRFVSLFVSCITISLPSLSDFGRRLRSRFIGIVVSCVTISVLSLSGFGRRLCFFIFARSRFTVIFVSCISVDFLCLADFGRRLSEEVIKSFIGAWGPFSSPFPDFLCPFPFPVFFFGSWGV